jgi:hypothetical protein
VTGRQRIRGFHEHAAYLLKQGHAACCIDDQTLKRRSSTLSPNQRSIPLYAGRNPLTELEM